ncbi:ORF1 in transposon ISC1316 [Saccharolobus solfataricus]|uniref:ORF1 in transposon ISC1316 n=1 Tax=Saccharolobus solfataricus TaxID=2287 RepID=A0A157T3A9_SACSO|nr:ORF1 in transposon ISC1316 [Saccharolobus solfataricus]
MALNLRKQDEEYKQLHSQVVQQIADRFYEAKKRFMDGLARFPREKKPHKYYSLVYSIGMESVELKGNKKKE